MIAAMNKNKQRESTKKYIFCISSFKYNQTLFCI